MVDQGISAARRLRLDKAPEGGAASPPASSSASIDGPGGPSTPSPQASIDGPGGPGLVSAGCPEPMLFPPRKPIPPPPFADEEEIPASPDT